MTPRELLNLERLIDRKAFRGLADEIEDLKKINPKTGDGELLMDEIDKRLQDVCDYIYQTTAKF